MFHVIDTSHSRHLVFISRTKYICGVLLLLHLWVCYIEYVVVVLFLHLWSTAVNYLQVVITFVIRICVASAFRTLGVDHI